MSYDIQLRGSACASCGHYDEPDLPDPTYNLAPIFDLALTGEPNRETDRPRGLRLLSGRKAGETAEELRVALGRLQDPAWRDRFLMLEPENRWGTLSDAVSVVVDLLAAAKKYPDRAWEIQ